MARLIYSAIASLDGYVEDAEGRFDWAEPDEEVFCFVNDLERPIGTYLYGRRMYETMRYWETVSLGDQPACIRDFTQIWRGADKIIYSRSLASAPSARTRIERSFDPEVVRRLKAAARDDLTIGGAGLAGQAIRAGLVDELQLFAVPVAVGGGKRWLPKDVRLDLQLADTRRFAKGFLYSNYRLKGQG
jgi:dihydrofolate reductase